MEDKTVLVTGATSGIGFHTAQALASKGAQVIVTGRNEEPTFRTYKRAQSELFVAACNPFLQL